MEMGNIAKIIAVLRGKQEREHERHKAEMARLDGLIRRWQDGCKHGRTRYHADPAGDSSESFSECLDCGKRI